MDRWVDGLLTDEWIYDRWRDEWTNGCTMYEDWIDGWMEVLGIDGWIDNRYTDC